MTDQKAEVLTKEYTSILKEIDDILLSGIENIVDGELIWENKKDKSKFYEESFPPFERLINQESEYYKIPLKPDFPVFVEPKKEYTEQELSELVYKQLKISSAEPSITGLTLIIKNNSIIVLICALFTDAFIGSGYIYITTFTFTWIIVGVVIWNIKKRKYIRDFKNNISNNYSDYEQIKKKKIKEYNKNLLEWENNKKYIQSENNKYRNEIEEKNRIAFVKWGNDKLKYEEHIKEKRKEFTDNINKINNLIDKHKEQYFNLDKEAVNNYCLEVLNNSIYPDFLEKDFKIDYNNANKILVVEYFLPNIDEYPTINEVKYIKSKDELKYIYISNNQLLSIFDNTCYKISLRTIYELFSTDIANAIDMITFNGWINSISKATGKEVNTCILSIQVKKSEFMDIDLENVDPKICFRSLKGVGSSKLSGLSEIKPILQLNKEDKRFISSHNVIDSYNSGQNLAEMDWDDFEHLIREIFEKEFSVNGGEVKVTQASRDGGVDAIAFDPDPIRGGKIVIQAKKYTNTVGVSAVRDLFGTIMNEGANKGILVTTADYGPDAYEFAKGKPISLLNGNELLYLLKKHGHSGKIDLKEARRNLYGK